MMTKHSNIWPYGGHFYSDHHSPQWWSTLWCVTDLPSFEGWVLFYTCAHYSLLTCWYTVFSLHVGALAGIWDTSSLCYWEQSPVNVEMQHLPEILLLKIFSKDRAWWCTPKHSGGRGRRTSMSILPSLCPTRTRGFFFCMLVFLFNF